MDLLDRITEVESTPMPTVGTPRTLFPPIYPSSVPTTVKVPLKRALDFLKELTPKQNEGLEAFKGWDADPAGARERAIHLAGGLGTQLCFACINEVVKKGCKVMYVVSTLEELNHAERELEALLGIPIDVEQGSRRRSGGSPVLLTTNTTMRDERLAGLVRSGFEPNYLVFPQAQRSESRTYKAIDDAFSKSRVLNSTALPSRHDVHGRLPLGDPLVEASMDQLMVLGELANYRYSKYTISVGGVKFSEAYKRQKELQVKGIQSTKTGLITSTKVIESCAESIVAECFDHPEIERAIKGLVYCCTVNHVFAIESAIREADIRQHGGIGLLRVASITGKMDGDKRDEILQKYRDGELDLLINNLCLKEGFYDTQTNFIACLRPTDSADLWGHILYAGLNKSPTKKTCILMDAVDVEKFVGSNVEDAMPDPTELAQRTVELGRQATHAEVYLHWFRRKEDLERLGVKENERVPPLGGGQTLVHMLTGSELLSELIPGALDAASVPLSSDFARRAKLLDDLHAGLNQDDDAKAFSNLYDALNISHRQGFGGSGMIRKLFHDAGWVFCPHLIAPRYLEHIQTANPPLNPPVESASVPTTGPLEHAITELFNSQMTVVQQVDRFAEVLPYDPAYPNQDVATWFKPLGIEPRTSPDDFRYIPLPNNTCYMVRTRAGNVHRIRFQMPCRTAPAGAAGPVTYPFTAADLPRYSKKYDDLVRPMVPQNAPMTPLMERAADIIGMDPKQLQVAQMCEIVGRAVLNHHKSEEHRSWPCNGGKSDLEWIKDYLIGLGEL